MSWTKRTLALAFVAATAMACSDTPEAVLAPDTGSNAVGSLDGWDINSPLNGTKTIKGALWQWPVGFNVGTGQINPFLSIQKSGEEEGFNSLVKSLDGKRYTNFTHDLSLNHVPTIQENGIYYRELILDANEANSGTDARFAITIFDLWLCDDPDAPNYGAIGDFAGNGACDLVYSFGDSIAYATDEVTSGSGLDLDYRILIPEDNFTAAAVSVAGGAAQAAALLEDCFYQGADAPSCGVYLVLHTKMGGVTGWITGSTFEEFSTILRPVPARLKLVKKVVNDNGGTATVNDFGIVSSAGTPTWDAGVVAGDTTIYTSAWFSPLDAGSYTFAENDVAGYTEGSWSCDPVAATGTAYNAGSVTLAEGDFVTCTIVNNDIPPKLVLDKITSYSYGGTRPESDWTLNANGGTAGTLSGAGAAGSADVVSGAGFKAGTYALSETGSYTGYTNGTTFSCSKNGGAASSTNSITLAVADSAYCSITNTDLPASLQIIKRVVNDNGGTATYSAFGLSTTAGTLNFDAGVADGANTIKYTAAALSVAAGSYTLRENDIAGYAEGTWSCTGATPSDNTISAGAVDVPFGGTVVCTITNNDIPPKLVLDKITSYTYGGDRPESDWTLNANGGTAGTLSGAGAAGSADVVSGASFKAGTYALSETGSYTGYTNGTTFSCSKNGGAASSTNSITLALADSAYCSITNTDQPAKLTLVKRVVNDHGGTADYSAFGIATSAGSLTFGAGVADGANTLKYTSNTFDLSAGSYTFSENDVTGYTEGSWSCSPVTEDASAYGAGAVTLDNGDDVTCTITNDDDPAHLTLVKRIINDNGGTAVVGDFGIVTDAGSLTFGAGVADGTATLKYTSNKLTVSAGTYNFSEMDLALYDEGTWSCSPVAATGTAYNAGSVALANGDDVTCMITNDDNIPPTYETAFAFGGDPAALAAPVNSECFIDNGFSNWGWTNQPITEGTYTWPVYAGAAQCDTDNGMYAGTVTVDYSGGTVGVTWNLLPGFSLMQEHIYAGYDMFPTGSDGFPTVAPGQYTVGTGLSGAIWVIVHGVLSVPSS